MTGGTRTTDRVAAATSSPVTERQGRRWIFGSFLLCPCHLPLTLAVVSSLAGGTVIGGLLRDHVVLAGSIISLGWLVGTANGFRLVRHAQRGTCPAPLRVRIRRRGHAAGAGSAQESAVGRASAANWSSSSAGIALDVRPTASPVAPTATK